ncbi:CRISPR-associated endonuclease Cas3'' [Halopenitus persicus]|uniref:CRISPR-associated endonuclease Cas3'' n=1 Tax=Halopenitus persicus TaxID=1048396 RepID=UPI00057C71B0|nr:CRISPR-associated endonuclease Cas3'' [Halopenitus persicus]QHS17818.1 CRISPR-associated endonuclease Cas3'' [haloarchaeon 3A1-DGR]
MTVRYSHPPEDERDGVHLTEHLQDVAERSRHIVSEDAQTPAGESLLDLVETLAYVHDFGKATTYFQEYLLDSVHPDPEPLRHHAPLGAFVAYDALDARGFETESCLAGFVAVAKHHGSLPDVAEYVYKRSHRRDGISPGAETSKERRQKLIAKQAVDIRENAPEIAETVFDWATNGKRSVHEFIDEYPSLLNNIESAVSADGSVSDFSYETLSDTCYSLVLESWGSLVLADKTSAAGVSEDTDRFGSLYAAKQPNFERLDEHVHRLEREANADPNGTRRERLNHHRSRARNTVLRNAEEFGENEGNVATLTLPTGMGKTLSGLSAAFTIRDQLDGDRVIYALPFTSIIDQVVDEVEDIYDTDSTGRVLTAHHHLSETTIEDDDEKADLNDDVSGMLAESWRAGLTVSTYVQLFESLAGPSNGQSMKLPALRDSVVILDEPQSLPLDWWKLVPRLVSMLTDRYDATVIAMTATQPRLFENAIELVDEPTSYFETAERVEYEIDPSVERYIEDQTGAKSYADAAEQVIDHGETTSSTLAICNTIDSAKRLTERLDERLDGAISIGSAYKDALFEAGSIDVVDPSSLAEDINRKSDQGVLHLSTRLRPVDRLTLIEIAKHLTERGYPLITVSTQLVEAGVDISFDRVFRDLAPIDSIVQAAGRCNRSFERERGHVTVWWLDVPDEQTKTPAEAVYNRGVALLPVAANTIEDVRAGRTTIPEVDLARDGIEEYYRRLKNQKNVGKQEYVEYVDQALAGQLADLSLIDQRRTVDIVVCRTKADRNTVREIEDATARYDFATVETRLKELRTKQISVPIYQDDSKEAREIADFPTIAETDIRWIDPTTTRYEDFFDADMGFLVPDDTVERRFL